jgi:LAGLIDADG endonuclease
LAGFADAYSSFVINLGHSTTHKFKMIVRLEFKIKQKNVELLEKIKQTFGGHVYYLELEKFYYYNTFSFKIAKSVISYFDCFHLNSSK